jgi:hypothetical protein
MGKVVIEQGEYRGSPTVSIRNDTEEQKYPPFSFGLKKAKLLLQALAQEPDFIKKFVEENE